MNDFIPQTDLSVGVLTVLYQRGLAWTVAPDAHCVTSFLCAGCGNGEGHVAPVYAKWSPALVFAVKLNGFSRFSLKMASGALGASGCPLGVPWVSPWCLLGAPGCVLGASWVPPGCSWVPPWCSLVPPGWSWVPPGCAWVPPGCFCVLLDASRVSLGCHIGPGSLDILESAWSTGALYDMDI